MTNNGQFLAQTRTTYIRKNEIFPSSEKKAQVRIDVTTDVNIDQQAGPPRFMANVAGGDEPSLLTRVPWHTGSQRR